MKNQKFKIVSTFLLACVIMALSIDSKGLSWSIGDPNYASGAATITGAKSANYLSGSLSGAATILKNKYSIFSANTIANSKNVNVSITALNFNAWNKTWALGANISNSVPWTITFCNPPPLVLGTLGPVTFYAKPTLRGGASIGYNINISSSKCVLSDNFNAYVDLTGTITASIVVAKLWGKMTGRLVDATLKVAGTVYPNGTVSASIPFTVGTLSGELSAGAQLLNLIKYEKVFYTWNGYSKTYTIL